MKELGLQARYEATEESFQRAKTLRPNASWLVQMTQTVYQSKVVDWEHMLEIDYSQGAELFWIKGVENVYATREYANIGRIRIDIPEPHQA